MGEPRDYHRPLVSGIQIKSGTGPFSIRTVGAGTLTGLATRNSDGKKMLVANLHVMAGEGDNGEYREPTGSEEMYQDLLTSDKRVGTNLVWVPIASGQSNVADVAMCELGDGVDANFILHDHPNHGSRKIIGGTVEPTEGMELTMLGASTGERMVTVADVGIARNLNGRDFTGLVKLNRRGGSIAWDGDSGAPCLFKVREGVYRIACIVFAANVLDPIAWAFPASVAERELGITFGNRPPVVNARSVSQNRARNGSFEQGAWVGWRGLGNVNPGISTSAAKEGSRSLELTLPAGSSDLANPDIQHSSYDVPVTAGERWYAEAWVKGDYFRDGAYARVALFWYGQDGRRMAYELSPQYTAVSGSWDRLRVTGQAPAGARNVRVVVTLDGPAEASGHCWFDLVRLEQSITSVDAGDTVTLDGSWSSDPDRDALTYRWEQVFGSERLAIAERGITLSDNTAAAPTFTAPSNPRILTIKLTVTDLYGATTTDTVKITVRATVPPAAPANLRATPSDRRVSLRWDYPDNTSITRYEYRLRLGANSWGDWTTVPSSGAATVGYVKVGLTNGTAYSFQTRAVNEHGAGQSVEAGPVTPTAPTPPDPPTPWRDTGSTRGCGPDKEKEQRRTSSGRRQTRWVAAPEAETWGSWSRTGRTLGSNQSRKAEESCTSNCDNTQTRWVAYPEPETWGSWSRTGNTRGSGIWHESEEACTSSYGNRQTRWVDDPESETWGSWFRTGNTRGSAQNRESEEARTGSYGNRQTRWVSDPAETWGSWRRTGNERYDGDQPMVEEERTSSYGNRQTRWVPVL